MLPKKRRTKKIRINANNAAGILSRRQNASLSHFAMTDADMRGGAPTEIG